METTTLAGIEVPASRVGLGTWAIGGWMWGGTDEARSIATIHAAIDRGITVIDTAPVYGFGVSEAIVGKALASDGRRRRVVLATKCGLNWTVDEQPFRDGRRARIEAEIDASLQRLRTDVIDLYQVHWPDPETPFEETAEALADLQHKGKIRAIGVSNYSPTQMDAFRVKANLAAAQPPYNLFERGIERDILPYCRAHGIATLVYGALCRGLLSGRMTATTAFGGDDLRRHDPKFRGERFGAYVTAVDRLDAYARERFDKSVIALAVRWLLDQPGVSVALWGARRPDQLDPIADAMGWRLDDAAMADIDRIVATAVGEPLGPEFMAPPLKRPAGV